MSTLTSRKPLQDISNKVHLVKPATSQINSSSLMKSKTKEMIPVKQSKSSRMLDIRANKYDTPERDDDMDYGSPTSIGSLEEEFGELSDLREFYDEVSSDINDKIVKSLEREKEKNTRLELQSERDKAQILELQEEKNKLARTIDQLKKPKVEKPEIDFNGQVKQLNDKISKLEKKVEVETQHKERLTNLLKTKEQALTKIKEENDLKVTKGPIEEKCSRKLQDQIKIKEEKIERMSKEIEKEKNTKQEYENLIQGLQEVSDNLRMKLSASNEEIETSNKLIEILDAKLKIANDRSKDLDERLKKGEEKREEESSELLALREEMSHLCDSVLKEKQESERKTQQLNQIQAAKEKYEKEYTRTCSKLKEKEEETEELKQVIEKLEQQIEQMGHDIDDSSKELEEIEENFRTRLADAEDKIAEKEEEIRSMKEKEERTMEQLKELDVFVERTKRKIDKEKEKTKDSEERANAEYEKALQMIERNNALMRKLEAVTRANHSLEEEVKEKEDLMLRFKNYIEDVENKLHDKEEECNQTVSRLNTTYEELQKEKAKSERSWKELEETVKMLHQIQSEKEVLEKKSSHSKEVLEMKMNNKISMLEKKCDYLKRLHEMNGATETDQIKEMENYIDRLTKENEKAGESVSQLEITLSEKDSEISVLNEKVRQLEDLLNNQNQLHSANLKPNDLKKRLMAVEKSMDEIIIELSIEGITLSQLNPREKAVVILEKFTDIKKECHSLTSIKDQYSAELQRLREAKANSERQMITLREALSNEVVESNEGCITDLSDSCTFLYNTLTGAIEQRELEEKNIPLSQELLDELLESVLSIQVNLKKVSNHLNQVDTLQQVINSQNTFNKDFVSLCGELENRVRSLMEERDTLLTAQFQLKDKEKGISNGVKKKLDKLMYKNVMIQTSSQIQSVEEETQTEASVGCGAEQEEQPCTAEREQNPQMDQEHESLKNKYQKLLATCHKYKKLMLKFTQLHTKEKTNVRQSIAKVTNQSHTSQQDSVHDEQEDEPHQEQYEEEEEEEQYVDQEDYPDVPVIRASLHHPLSFDKENTTPTRHNQSNGDSRDNSPSNSSVSSVRSVSTTLSAASERSNFSTLSSKFRKNQAPKDFNKPNSYLSSHMSVRQRLK